MVSGHSELSQNATIGTVCKYSLGLADVKPASFLCQACPIVPGSAPGKAVAEISWPPRVAVTFWLWGLSPFHWQVITQRINTYNKIMLEFVL